jgi:hypothetical protein
MATYYTFAPSGFLLAFSENISRKHGKSWFLWALYIIMVEDCEKGM